MKRVYEIIRQLQKTSGSIAKKDILLENVDNSLLKQFIFFTYEPTISFYQKKIVAPQNTMFTTEPKHFDQEAMKSVVDMLGNRKVTGNAAIAWLGELFNSIEDTMHIEAEGVDINYGRELLKMMIARSISAGVSIETFNKVWPDLLTNPPYLRCSLPKHVDMENWNWSEGVDSEIKYDGEYSHFFIFTKGEVNIESRAGSRFTRAPFDHIIDDMQDLSVDYFFELYPREEYIVYCGELEMMDPEGNVLPREIGNGMINSILQTGENTYDATPIYRVWDFIPGTKFEARAFNMPRKERRAHLVAAFAEPKEYAKLAEVRVCYSHQDAMTHYREMRALKKEGTVVKHPAGVWADTTSKHQVKLKEVKDVDLVVKGFKEGNRKYVGMLGSFDCESSDGLLQVNVSGISDYDRKEIWENREYYLGKIIPVSSNGIMKAKKGKKQHSLFIPVTLTDDSGNIMWRHDKTVADSYQRIKEIFGED